MPSDLSPKKKKSGTAGEQTVNRPIPKQHHPSPQTLHPNDSDHLVEALRRRHGSLDGKAANVLPALLEKGNEVVDGQHDVGNKLLLGHANVANSNTHAENLLELELDGGLDFVDTAGKIVGVGDGSRELASLGQTGTEQTGNLLDEGVGGDEGIVLASKLLDELLVLVELLEIVGAHGVDTAVLGTVDIVLVTKNADGHVGAGDSRQLDGTAETLVTLGVCSHVSILTFQREASRPAPYRSS